ncbi:MAG: hypothetical protein IPP55_18270 [Anaerolineales bacterium]|nr:hypothetical protein [Anaerolineales bacterium]
MKLRSSIQDLLTNSVLRRLNLRAKLTLGNLAITFLVVIVMGTYVYLRIQEASTQLIASVEENARARAEEDLQSANREQAAFLESFFENMSRNTLVAAASVQNILEDDQLENSSYWDAETQLIRLASGSWDNANTETASVFIPSDVILTSSLVRKLNLLKHSELVFPSMLKGSPDIVAIYFGGQNKETFIIQT